MKSEQTPTPTSRADRMRTAIIAMVDASPYGRPRRGRRMTVLVSCVSVVAGLLAGGGISAAAFASSGAPNLQSDLQNDARYNVGENYGKLVGQPHFIQTAGKTTIDLGKAPSGATLVEITFQCLDPGVFTQTIDGDRHDEKCTASESRVPSTHNAEAQGYPVAAGGTHTVSVDSHGTDRYAVLVSWVRRAVLATPSAQQQLELSDGKITLDEYVEAFNRFEGCMAEAGHPMGVVPLTDGLFHYGLPEAAEAASDTQCYPREFEDVDIAWQTQGQ